MGDYFSSVYEFFVWHKILQRETDVQYVGLAGSKLEFVNRCETQYNIKGEFAFMRQSENQRKQKPNSIFCVGWVPQRIVV